MSWLEELKLNVMANDSNMRDLYLTVFVLDRNLGFTRYNMHSHSHVNSVFIELYINGSYSQLDLNVHIATKYRSLWFQNVHFTVVTEHVDLVSYNHNYVL